MPVPEQGIRHHESWFDIEQTKWFWCCSFRKRMVCWLFVWEDTISSGWTPALLVVCQVNFRVPSVFDIFCLQEQLSEAHCIQYADDTVVFVAHQNLETINETLNNELCKLQAYFRNNELVLNLKKGKTETVYLALQNDCQSKFRIRYL